MKAIRMIRSTSIRTFLGIAFASALTTGSAFAQKVSYYHLDALGNVRIITDATGNAIERHDYLPFGEECTTGPCASNPGVANSQPVHFTGKERDKETGLDYFGARYYRGNVGRFTTVDPALNSSAAMFDPQRWNRYAYSRNNPLRFVDPDGRDIFTYFGGIAVSVGSNLTGGLIPRPQYSDSDYQFGQRVGDAGSIIAAGYEGSAGGGLALGGEGLTLSIAGAEVGVPATVAGGALAAHALAVASSATISLSKNVGDPGGPKPGSAGGAGAGKRFSEGTKAAAREESPNCVFCDNPTTNEPGPSQSNIDHSIPKSRNGNNTLDNAQNTCRTCNLTKGTQTSEEFVTQ